MVRFRNLSVKTFSGKFVHEMRPGSTAAEPTIGICGYGAERLWGCAGESSPLQGILIFPQITKSDVPNLEQSEHTNCLMQHPTSPAFPPPSALCAPPPRLRFGITFFGLAPNWSFSEDCDCPNFGTDSPGADAVCFELCAGADDAAVSSVALEVFEAFD